MGNESTPHAKVVTRAIVYNQEGKVLLGRRAGGVGADQWALLGGKPNRDEPLETCVRRELTEESGGDFDPEYYRFCVDTSMSPTDPWHVHYYTGSFCGQLQLNPLEISEARFVGPNDLDELDIAFGHREILIEYFARRLS